jgi:hypothetical protein
MREKMKFSLVWYSMALAVTSQMAGRSTTTRSRNAAKDRQVITLDNIQEVPPLRTRIEVRGGYNK